MVVLDGPKSRGPRCRRLSRRLLAAGGAFLIAATPLAAQERPPTLTDIVETRSIDGLALSPDGRHIAFRVIAPSVARNRTAEQWYSVPIDGGGEAEALGHPAEPLRMPVFDMPEDGAGQWDPRSRSLFVLQQRDSTIQVHRLRAGGRDEAVTRDPADVVSFRLADDGARIRYQVRNSRDDIALAQANEELTGIHLDRTLFTEGLRLTENYRIGERQLTVRRVAEAEIAPVGAGTLRDREVSVAHAAPSASAAARSSGVFDNSINPFVDPDPSRALAPSVGDLKIRLVPGQSTVDEAPFRRFALQATLPDGAVRECRASFCRGLSAEIRELTTNPATGEAVIVFEPSFSARATVYGWNPRTDATRTIYSADGSLDGGSAYGFGMCPRTGRYLLCVQSGPARPPRLIRLDLTSGAVVTLSDPNRQLAGRLFTETRFLTWKDSFGRPASGVLTLPPNPQYPLPLVITTYRCRGFLRGGTARLAPEHVLAQSGIASLCVGLNNAVPLDRGASGNLQPLARIKASVAAYAAAIDLLAGRGIVDRAKVGIAGHSYSSNVIAYAISHSDLFAVAVIGTGVTIDPDSYYLTAPTSDSWRKNIPTVMGLPRPTDDRQGVWSAISPALNAARIRTPLLIQAPESEYLFALQLLASIQDARGTTDMYVYPNEGHMVERQPIHGYWRARRSVDWFAFWLGGTLRRTPETALQFGHWDTLKQARLKDLGTAGIVTGPATASPAGASPRSAATPPHPQAP